MQVISWRKLKERIQHSGGFQAEMDRLSEKVSQEWRFDSKFKQSLTIRHTGFLLLPLQELRKEVPWTDFANLLICTGIQMVPGCCICYSRKAWSCRRSSRRKESWTEDEYSGYYYGSGCVIRLSSFTPFHSQKEEEALPLLKAICDDLNTEIWYSTQSLAWDSFPIWSIQKWFLWIIQARQNSISLLMEKDLNRSFSRESFHKGP